MEICDYKYCTGCGACVQKCPKHCISMEPDSLDALYPIIDKNQCISCGLCQKACPNNHNLPLNKSIACYVAWSKSDQNRLLSASGGIAAEIYKHCIKNDIFTTGVRWTRDKGAHYIAVESDDDIEKVRNSKYVYSNTNFIFQRIKLELEHERKVVFIGLPCQVSGLYSFLGKAYNKLTTIDIICHGVCPNSYLDQHISSIERRKEGVTSYISFRDPLYLTYTFTLTLKNKDNKLIYKNNVRSTDNYQLGYHHALTYRENCYICKYAQQNRTGDLTIGDFSGLGRIETFNGEKRNVSCVLVNSDKGAALIKEIDDCICYFVRPVEEAFKYEAQLQHPSIPHKMREHFVHEYQKRKNFEDSCNISLKRDKINVFLRVGLWKSDVRRLVKYILPKRAIQIITGKRR